MMTHSSDFSNGASLEDCRTNFFALSDLNGVKWRRLCGSDSITLDPGEDPVLLAYCECISSGILAAWRRVSNEVKGYVLGEGNRLSCFKELWIFWCGDEPDFSKLLTSKLYETEQGSWESGLSYEGRTLFFKALHNAIEKDLLSYGYARFGKYFVEPQILDVNTLNSKKQKAIAFDFFIHGESTVCASIDIRLMSPIYILDKSHVAAAQSGHPNIKVILCPYGLAGKLTSTGYKYSDPNMARFLNEWNNYFPHHWKRDQWKMNSEYPHVVEVIVGGARMKYPISYVFVTEEDHLEAFLHQQTPRHGIYNLQSNQSMSSSLVTNGLLTPPLSPNVDLAGQKKNFKSMHWDMSHIMVDDPRQSVQIVNHVSLMKRSISQDCFSSIPSDKCDENSSLWDFQDPSHTSKCTCSRLSRKYKKKHSSSSISHSTNQKCSRNHKSFFSHNKIPFHRQPPSLSADESLLSKDSRSHSKNDASFTKPNLSSNLPQLFTSQVKQESLSNTPSDAFYTPTVTLDPVMPTLSPQPPVPMIKEEIDSQSPDSCQNISSSSSSESLHGVTLKGKISEEILSPLHTSLLNMFENTKGVSRLSTFLKLEPCTNDEVNLSLPHQALSVQSPDSILQVLEKPSLPKRQYDDPDGAPVTMTGLLYDYKHLSDPLWAPSNCVVATAENPYDSYDEEHESEANIVETKPEIQKLVPCIPKDPYEFTDIDDTAPSEKGFRPSSDSLAREEEKFGSFTLLSPIDGSPALPSQGASVANDLSTKTLSPPSNKTLFPKFIREEDLAVSLNDLENIFDTSSSDEETVETDLMHAKVPAYDEFVGKIELSRIYPTPPSWEQIAVPSPMGNTVVGSDSAIPENEALREHVECDNYELVLEDEEINVFIPPLIHVFPETPEFSSLDVPSSCDLNSELVYKSSFNQFHPRMNLMPSVEDTALNTNTGTISSSLLLNSEQNISFYNLDSSQDFLINQPSLDSFSSASSMSFTSKCNNVIAQSNPELNPLVVNLILSDSLLNIFKDINFSCCSICVCNMNIKGSDAGIILPSSLMPSGNNEPQYKCTCGFSALVHRHKSYQAGLFYEDEVDIYGTDCDTIEKILTPSENVFAEENFRAMPYSSKHIPDFIMDILRVQCKSIASSFSLFHKSQSFRETSQPVINNLDFMDSCEVCFMAMEGGKNAMGNLQSKLDKSLKSSCLHKWPFLSSPLPTSSHDSMLILDSLKPLLQVAIHKKNTQKLWDVTYIVSGPLTWKEFHRLAPRGTEDQCEPQPIPFLCAGSDGDHTLFSPFAMRHWDKLNLEPYSLPRDVAYIVVAPENDSVLSQIKSFFKDLSCSYEHHNLGKHRPITKVLRDGIMRVGKTAASKVAEEPVNEWFNSIGDGPIPNKLRLYARVCKHRLAPHLSTLPLDNTIFENSSSSKSTDKYDFSPSFSSDSNDHSNISKDNGMDSYISGSYYDPSEEDESQPPALVIYIVEPFTFGQFDANTYRLVTLGLLHSYADMLLSLPEAVRDIINIQLISLDSIISSPAQKETRMNELKALAFSVFSQSHRMFSYPTSAKSLTGFGPAAAQELFLSKNKSKISSPLKVYNQPYLVQFRKDKQTILGEMFGDERDNSGTLHCSYCLSKDKRFIVASCTNEKGEFCETNIINVDVPNRHKRKHKSILRFGLCKLLEFMFEVMSVSFHPWRLIIERFGRLGQGELKTWAGLLSRKSLNSYSKRLRDICRQCSVSGVGDVPCILSVCLVSIEPDSSLRVLPDLYTPDRFSMGRYKYRRLNSPDDASCTHILVFPTSATTQSSQVTLHQEHIDPLSGGLEDDFFEALNDDDINNAEINDIFKWTENSASPGNSPCHESASQPSSPNSAFKHSYPNEGTNQFSSPVNFQDEPLLLLQQPLALGYYVSTAKSSTLPKWFWSSCPQLEHKCPVFLKSALLIHVPYVQKNSDDLLQSSSQQQLMCHPMDSSYTTDVLRYVLESHNTLSWLALDSSYQDRRSCLPLHIQTLIQLYDIVEVLL